MWEGDTDIVSLRSTLLFGLKGMAESAHGYPGLKKYKHLAGNFGTAWQSQQQEFENIPAPILFTTNCIMPPRESYQDRVYTTSVVGYEGLKYIERKKDITAKQSKGCDAKL